MKTFIGQRSTIATTMALHLLSVAALLLASGIGPARAAEDTAMAIEPLPVVLCDHVRTKCAYDAECGAALHNYFAKCDPLIQADSTKCHEPCLYALVSLTTTTKGRSMMDCTCRDKYCEEMKSRVEVCRPLVLETSMNETLVSCRMAQWICLSDSVCRSAMDYYQMYCKRMLLQGSSCTERCLNSLEILMRQERGMKLNRCRCDGTFECLRNKERVVRLCYGGNKSVNGTAGGRKNRKKHKPRMFDMDPDRAVVEMMLANPGFLPEGWKAYNATFGDGGGGSSAAPRVRAGHPSAVAAAVVLVTRSLSVRHNG